jgi:FkbM family methyltransferase
MFNAKEMLRTAVRSAGYDFRKHVPTGGKPINILELTIRSKLLESPEFSFVQIGANDGVMNDPLYPLVKKYRLKGLLIEPMPDFIDRLRLNYSDQAQLRFENCAVSDEDGERDLFRVRQGSYKSEYVAGLASFDRRVLLRHKKFYPGIEKQIEVLRVKTLTIDTLLKKHGIFTIDLLQVDTEGFDGEILRMVLARGITPAIINYEHRHLSFKEQDAVRDLLELKGYRFHFSRYDTLAILDGLPYS